MNDITVVICAYRDDRWEDLKKAVASLKAQTLAPAEILLAIDHNGPLAERCREELSGVRVVENREVQGLSGTRNVAIAHAVGNFVAFLDDDGAAAPDWLEKLAAPLGDETVMGVGGGSQPNWDGEGPHWFPKEFYWAIGCSYTGLPETTAPVRNTFGGTVVYRRDLFPVVGGFLSEIGRNHAGLISCEETEFCIRANQRWPERHFIYEPAALIYHRVPAPRQRFGFFLKRCYDEGRSKAVVARLVGAQDGLSEERSYATRVLPLGVIRNVGETVRKGDLWGLARAGAIVAGLAATSAGYVVGVVRAGRGRAQADAAALQIATGVDHA
ncbi:MAG: glycosyltransferase family 2 protein [Dehalococcoidia bacterium]